MAENTSPAPKRPWQVGNQRALGNKGGPGHKSKYREEYAAQVTKLAMLGCTDEEIGQYFDVAESVIGFWQKRHPEFAVALKKGRSDNTMRVVGALFKRASGFYYKRAIGHKKVMDGSVKKEIPITERVYVPPDPTSIIFFLTNRCPQYWKRNDQARESQFQAERKGKLHELWAALAPNGEEPLPEERKPS